MSQKTRTDKIVEIKNSNVSDIVKNIDLHSCSDEQINRVHTMVTNQKNGIPRSADDWVFIKIVKDEQCRKNPVGKWS